MKEAALRLGLPVHQPERIRRAEVVEQLKQMKPDAMVVVGYGQIIPQAIIDIPPRGIINVHARCCRNIAERRPSSGPSRMEKHAPASRP